MAALHEDPASLSAETRELHRALASLIEELEAVDWYQQRIDATSDAVLRAVLAHNRDEEIEHACMVLEWVRRRSAAFDRQLRRVLFGEGPIAAEGAEAADPAPSAPGDGSLGIGRMRVEAAS
jgi:ferritin-like protein